jgi:hypothetical protein
VSAPPDGPGGLAQQDVDQLRWLQIFYYVTTGLLALAGCFPLIHLTIGAFLAFGPAEGAKGDPRLVGWIFMAIAIAIMAFLWTLAAMQYFVARNLERRRRHTFCVVVAAITAAMCVPLGTALGVFTIIVLMRPQVKAAFGVSV